MKLNGVVARTASRFPDSGSAAPTLGLPPPKSKISIPPQGDWVVARPRVFERLSDGSRGPLTVVTGPPGAGKTVAVASWAASGRAAGPVAWVSCDDGDKDPAVFWRDVAAALELVGVAVSPSSIVDCAQAVLSDVALDFETRAVPVVLVLDDFQPEPGSILVDELSHLIKHTGPGLTLVLVGRVDPPLALHRYRLNNELTEIRAPDLMLSERETAALLAQHGVALKPATVRVLRERTEGWAAGVRLAAMSLEGSPDPDLFVAEFTGDDRAVVGYLVEEALDCQPSDMRRLMLTLSVAERFNSELALELAGGGSEQRFSAMVRANAFVMPLGSGWYRYHHMFGAALRLVLRHERPADVPVLYRGAATWFNRKGLLVEAVRHAIRAGDWMYASQSVVDHLAIGQVLGLVKGSPLAGAFAGMPERVASNGPRPEPALVAAAIALARGNAVGCAAALGHADVTLGGIPEDQGTEARLTADVLRLFLQASQDLAAAPDMVAASGRILDRISTFALHRHPELQALVSAMRGRTDLWAGRLVKAAAAFGEAVTAASEAGGDSLRRYCLGYSALVEASLGRLRHANDLAAKAHQLPEVRASHGGLPAGALYVAGGWLYLERYELENAEREFTKADEVIQTHPDACISALQGLILARVELAKGSPFQGLETLDAIRFAVQQLPWLDRMATLIEAEAHAAAGAASAALAAAERAGGLAAPDSAVALVRAQVCRGDTVAALRTLRPLLSRLAAAPTELRVEAMLLDAHLSWTTGDTSRARRSVDRALRLAQRDRICLPFAMSKEWLGPLLRQDHELVRQHHQLLEPLHLARTPQIGPANGSISTANGRAPEPAVFGRLSAR
jgi:LuxR family maltose regulon positive regulatory protein